MRKDSFTLLEAIFSISILVLTIGGAFALVQSTIGFTPITQQKLIASYLAQEGIEIIRNIRDTNWIEGDSWNEGLTHCSGNCDNTINNGCIADYKHSYGDTQEDPNLPDYTGQNLNIDSDGFYSYSTTLPFTQTKFKRKIVINPAGDVLEVCVLVEWEEKGRTHSIKAMENLYKWR